MRIKLLLTMLLLMLGPPLFAQRTTGIQNITTGGADCSTATNCVQLLVDPNSASSSISLSGTWTGTANFEVTADSLTTNSANWQALSCVPTGSSTAVTSATGNGVWVCAAANITSIRVRDSAGMTGTTAVVIRSSPAAPSAKLGGGGSGGGGTVPTITGGVQGEPVVGASTTALANAIAPLHCSQFTAGTTAAQNTRACIAAAATNGGDVIMDFTGNQVIDEQIFNGSTFRGTVHVLPTATYWVTVNPGIVVPPGATLDLGQGPGQANQTAGKAHIVACNNLLNPVTSCGTTTLFNEILVCFGNGIVCDTSTATIRQGARVTGGLIDCNNTWGCIGGWNVSAQENSGFFQTQVINWANHGAGIIEGDGLGSGTQNSTLAGLNVTNNGAAGDCTNSACTCQPDSAGIIIDADGGVGPREISDISVTSGSTTDQSAHSAFYPSNLKSCNTAGNKPADAIEIGSLTGLGDALHVENGHRAGVNFSQVKELINAPETSPFTVGAGGIVCNTGTGNCVVTVANTGNLAQGNAVTFASNTCASNTLNGKFFDITAVTANVSFTFAPAPIGSGATTETCGSGTFTPIGFVDVANVGAGWTLINTTGSGTASTVDLIRINTGTYDLVLLDTSSQLNTVTNTIHDLINSVTITQAAHPNVATYITGDSGQVIQDSSGTTPAIVVGGATVPTGQTLTIASGGTLTCAGGSTCPSSGSGTVSSSTSGYIGQYTGATTIGTPSPLLDNGVTTSNTLTYAGTGGINVKALSVANPGGGVGSSFFLTQEGTIPTGLSMAGEDNCYADSTQHGPLCNFNGGTTLPLVQGPASTTASHFAQFNSTNGGLLKDAGALITVAEGGTNASTAANALISLFPTASEVGDLVYCATYSSGCTSWALLAGNTSGTKVLQETSAGAPSWVANSGGVSSVNTLTGAVVIENATAGQMAVSGGNGAALTGAADLTYATHTFSGTANTIFDLSAATGTAAFKVPQTTTNTASAAGVIDFDTTNKNFHGYVNGADSLFLNSAAALTTNVLPKAVIASGNMLMGNSLLTDTGTTATYTGTGGLAAPVFTATGTTAGFFDFPQGTTSAAVAPCNTATSICLQAPTSVTSQLRVFASAPATGFPLFTNSSGTMTETITPVEGTISTGPFLFGSSAVNTVVAQTIAVAAGHFTNLVITSSLGGACTTAPTFNVFDGTSNTGTAQLATSTTQTKGTATSHTQTLTYAAGDLIGIYISTAGATCTTDTWVVSAEYSTP